MGREHRVSHRADPEAVELLDAIGRIEASPPLPERPAIVLSADKPWPSPAPDAHGQTSGGTITFAEWLAGQDLLAVPSMPRMSPRRTAGTISISISRGWSSTPFARLSAKSDICRDPARKITPSLNFRRSAKAAPPGGFFIFRKK
jgi:hypothetical protein